MSDEAAPTWTDAPPVRPRSAAFPRNAPEWINAGTGVGVLLLGVATFWNTIRISGVEDYFRSELAVRNQQVVTASDELRDLQERSNGLRQELAETSAAVDAARSEREALGLQVAELQHQERQLAADNNQLAEESAALGKENAMRDFSSRLMRTIFEFIEEARQGPDADSSNPGLQMLDALERGYAADPSENPYTRAIFAGLRNRCSGVASTPVTLGPYQTRAPTRSDGEAQGELFRLHEEERSRRFAAREEARQRAWTAIYECAADIIGASHHQY